jgi:hypothetical protein
MSNQEKNISQNKEARKTNSRMELENGFLEKTDEHPVEPVEGEKSKEPENEKDIDDTADLVEKKIKRRTIVAEDKENKSQEKRLHSYAEDISKMTNTDSQIESLLKLATEKNPITAIKVARHLDENYVLDKFHDKLMEEEIRKVLIEKGLL